MDWILKENIKVSVRDALMSGEIEFCRNTLWNIESTNEKVTRPETWTRIIPHIPESQFLWNINFSFQSLMIVVDDNKKHLRFNQNYFKDDDYAI